jgi:hypothetical protein
MDAFKLAGMYVCQEKVQQAKDDYNTLMRSSSKPSAILGKIFHEVANIAFNNNRELMAAHSVPAFCSLHYQEQLGEFDCLPNITFTTSRFYNPPHQDDGDAQEFAFLLFLPVNTTDGSLIQPTNNYHVHGGAFVFPDYHFGIDSSQHNGIVKVVWPSNRVRYCTLPALESSPHTQLGISLQIAKKTINTFRDIENGSIFNRPANRNKRKEDLYVAGHEECLNPRPRPHPRSASF